MIFANLQHNYNLIQGRIDQASRRSGRSPSQIRLVVVTKNHPVETVQALIDMGITDIGENRVQEIEKKIPHLHGNFIMHMIGHLQTNKAAKVITLVKWIQSIDSIRLIEKILAVPNVVNRKIKVLVEVNTSGEPSKSGCNPDECRMLAEKIASSGILEFRGLMTIGPVRMDETSTRISFSLLRRLGEQCKDLASSIELSMGMSSDFEWAIEEGATIVRIGSLLVGSRE